MKLRIHTITVELQAVTDDGETLRPVTMPPIVIEARDLPKLPDLIELARARAEAKLMAATPPKEE